LCRTFDRHVSPQFLSGCGCVTTFFKPTGASWKKFVRKQFEAHAFATMGMCAVTCCCPPMCAGASLASSVVASCAPRITLHPAWLLVSLASLLTGLGVYIDLTFKCQAVSAPWLGNEPVPGTGVWVNASDPDVYIYAETHWLPQDGTHDGEVLISATLWDRGQGEPPAWSLSPLAYQNAPSWSEGSGD